jgi:hypothetical protein
MQSKSAQNVCCHLFFRREKDSDCAYPVCRVAISVFQDRGTCVIKKSNQPIYRESYVVSLFLLLNATMSNHQTGTQKSTTKGNYLNL